MGENAVTGTLTMEITQVEGDKFFITNNVAFDGQEPNISVEERTLADYNDPAQVEEVIANCATQGGAAEMIVVPGGEFETCKFTQVGEGVAVEVWVANVPFANAQYHEIRSTENGVMEITAKYRGDK